MDQLKTKILIVDDDEDDYFIISDYIKEIEGNHFETDWCGEYSVAMEKINSSSYDIYFVDYRLGNQTGLELLKEAIKSKCECPIILLTGKGNKDIDVEAMRSGATDYLIKSELTTEKLERCIRYSIDRAHSLRKIRGSENKYRNLFTHSKDAIFIADQSLSFKEVNSTSSQLFGYSMDELLTKNLYEFIEDENVKKDISRLISKEENINDLEIEITDKDFERKPCILTISAEAANEDKHLFHGILHDITNLKKAEKVKFQAEKLAANERLVRILAHEIRNPLNNISLSVDHIKVSDPKQKPLIDIIKRNSIRINQIITELLDSTKPLELIFEKHSLQEILEESLAVAIDRINLQRITVEKTLPPGPCFISADKSKLKIAFTNIFINAVEAMEAGKGVLTISLKEINNIYRLSIQDNGSGISQESLPKLFEPFFTMKKNGMGLGLAASQSIFQSHRAAVQVKSEVGKGTTFIIEFSKFID